ncbi:MAG: hypothetical protein ACLRQ1_01885 [Ruminococcus sp.]|uniref:hypothetical protein n=1 Tax=Ruminococcus sp. TaxID=41978 RepID=UPI0039908E16
MIIETLINFAVGIFSAIISGLNFFSIPTDFINILATFCVYGNWIVGADILLLFAGCIASWFSIKIILGIVLFIWEELPLT